MEEAKKLEDYTYEDYLQIDKTTNERVELIFGKIYMMAGASAKHQDVVGNIFYLLKTLTKDSSCKPRIAPYDLKLIVNNQVNIVQPDIMIFCNNSSTPCAIFEVLSKSTAFKDKSIKKELYEKSGIKEYFLVDYNFAIVEKFKLINNKYEYIGAFSLNQTLPIDCIEAEINVDDIFEGI
ncbi:MAG: Uma2 family endonuclease, partial [Epsilonproteobacteria bacterium]|nr:Uma2 family endonuclease [Campylobacterota bacterium]